MQPQTKNRISPNSRILVYRGGAVQAIPSGGQHTIQFNTESFDRLAEFDNAATYRFTAKYTGDYLIHACVHWAALPAGENVVIFIVLNGLGSIAIEHLGTGINSNYSHSVTTIYRLTAGNTIEVQVTQNSGINRNINTGIQYTYLCITRLGM